MKPLPETHILRHLRVTPLQVNLSLSETWRGPVLKTLLLRSGLGFHLRRRECLTQAPTCESCTLQADCWYAFAFDTPRTLLPATTLHHGDTHVSHPFYLVSSPLPVQGLSPCLLTLFGRSSALLPKLLTALDEAGRSGRWGARFRVHSVVSVLAPNLRCSGEALVPNCSAIDWPFWQPPEPREVRLGRLRFLSPLRLRHAGRIEQAPVFSDVARALFRRIHLLAALYSGIQLESGWMKPLLEQAEALIAEQGEWRFVREDRRSGRQQRAIPFDGVLGEIVLAGDLSFLWPFLEVGQWTGVGASTAHGMGCYEVTALPQTQTT